MQVMSTIYLHSSNQITEQCGVEANYVGVIYVDAQIGFTHPSFLYISAHITVTKFHSSNAEFSQ